MKPCLIIEQEASDAANNNIYKIRIKGCNGADCEVSYDCGKLLGRGCITVVYR